jgi:hypothetical protein
MQLVWAFSELRDFHGVVSGNGAPALHSGNHSGLLGRSESLRQS